MENNEVVYLYLDDIIPNRFQPREIFDDQALKELAVSIKEHGVIQPIIVRKVENKYEIIAGERRYKASTMAGLTKIPAIVKNLDDKESSKVALIENLQRRDLTPIEEARTYQKILELENGMTQEQLAQTMGKTQSVVSNKLRLLALPDEVQDALLKEKISERHARSLLNINNKNDQVRMLDKIIAERMTVRELDKEIKEMNDNQGQMSGNNSSIAGGSSISLFDNNVAVNNIEASNNGLNVSAVPVIPPISQDNFGGSVNNFEASLSGVNTFNPTSVDIDKIRENAVDIGGNKAPTVDIKDLMKDINSNTNNDFKFVPTSQGNDNVSAETVNVVNNTNPFNFSAPTFNEPIASSNNFVSQVTELPGVGSGNNGSSANTENLSNFFQKDLSVNGFSPITTPATNNFASVMNNGTSAFNLNSFTNPDKKDVTVAINDIKDVIKNIETKGYNVLFEENDSDNTYQITIKVNKNF